MSALSSSATASRSTTPPAAASRLPGLRGRPADREGHRAGRTRPAPACASRRHPPADAARCGGRAKPRRRSARRSASSRRRSTTRTSCTSARPSRRRSRGCGRLKAELEAGAAGELPLLVTHGIFTRFFLLDSVLGERFEAPMAAGIWNLGSHNCGLSVFAHGESRDPLGQTDPRLDLPHLDGAAVESALTIRTGSSGETCHCSLTIAPSGGATGPSSSGSSVSRIHASSRSRSSAAPRRAPGRRRGCRPPAGRAPGRRAAPRALLARPIPPRPGGPWCRCRRS